MPQSESMGRVSRDARLLFVLLWPICDDHGRTRAASRMLASLLFPYDNDAPGLVDGWLDELEREDCIRRYIVDGTSYLYIPKWLIHQKIDKPSKPVHPDPPEGSPKPREGSGKAPPRKGRERKGMEGNGGEAPPATPTPPAAPPVVVIPITGGEEYGVTQAQVDEFRQLYPAVDVMQELRSMRGWCLGNPAKRKTRTGVLRFITNWLDKEQDKGPRPGAASVGARPERIRQLLS